MLKELGLFRLELPDFWFIDGLIPSSQISIDGGILLEERQLVAIGLFEGGLVYHLLTLYQMLTQVGFQYILTLLMVPLVSTVLYESLFNGRSDIENDLIEV